MNEILELLQQREGDLIRCWRIFRRILVVIFMLFEYIWLFGLVVYWKSWLNICWREDDLYLLWRIFIYNRYYKDFLMICFICLFFFILVLVCVVYYIIKYDLCSFILVYIFLIFCIKYLIELRIQDELCGFILLYIWIKLID